MKLNYIDNYYILLFQIACDVVELAYNDYANATQRSKMMQEFFGPEFRLFKEEIHSIEDAFKKYPEKKDLILKEVYNALQQIIDKGVFTNSMIHTLMRQYLENATDADRQSIIESVREHLLPIVHTRDGARVAMYCLWHGTNKDRKTIIKSFKSHFLKIATEQHSYMVLLAAFDCIDDTVFLKKAVLDELMSDINFLKASESGVRVLKYLVAPRSTMFFVPELIKVLSLGDDNKTSKKDSEKRKKEIFDAVSEPILRCVEDNIEEWFSNSQWTLFIGAALKVLSGNSTQFIFKKIAEICNKPYNPEDQDHFLEVSHSTKLITYLIKCDKEKYSKEMVLFSRALLDEASDQIPSWIETNRGCFLLVNIIETEIENVVKNVKELILPLKSNLEEKKFKGSEILLRKL